MQGLSQDTAQQVMECWIIVIPMLSRSLPVACLCNQMLLTCLLCSNACLMTMLVINWHGWLYSNCTFKMGFITSSEMTHSDISQSGASRRAYAYNLWCLACAYLRKDCLTGVLIVCKLAVKSALVCSAFLPAVSFAFFMTSICLGVSALSQLQSIGLCTPSCVTRSYTHPHSGCSRLQLMNMSFRVHT